MQVSSDCCSNPSLTRSLAAAVLTLGILVGAVGCDSESNTQKPTSETPTAESTDNTEKTQDEATAKQAEESAEETAEKAKQAANDKSGESEFSDAPKGKQKDKPDLPEDMPAGTTKHFGAEFQIDAEPITLATAMKKHVNEDEPVKVAASIKKVCKKKGCWFTLSGEDVDRKVRVRMKDYGFFVPRNTDGAGVVVEGTLKKRTMSEKEAKHYAKDQGKDPSSIDEEDLKVFEFTASGVRITRES
jgi:hypothetical protein